MILASAHFEQSLLYHAWKAQGVEFIEDKNLGAKLAFREHLNGHSLTIKYALSGLWSKHRRDQVEIEKIIIDAFRKELSGHRFLWQQNKDRELTNPFFGMEGATQLPYVPHGLNEYRGFHNAAILSASHLTPDHRAFHKQMWNLTDAQVTSATHLMTVYQAIMRSSLRVPENNDRKRILLPDHNTAASLAGFFPGSQLSCLDVDLTSVAAPKKRGRPAKYEGDEAERGRQRTRASRERKKMRETELR